MLTGEESDEDRAALHAQMTARHERLVLRVADAAERARPEERICRALERIADALCGPVEPTGTEIPGADSFSSGP